MKKSNNNNNGRRRRRRYHHNHEAYKHMVNIQKAIKSGQR